MTGLTKNDPMLVRDDDWEQVFEPLKQVLVQPLVLAYQTRVVRPSILSMDGRDTGMGAVLEQKHGKRTAESHEDHCLCIQNS